MIGPHARRALRALVIACALLALAAPAGAAGPLTLGVFLPQTTFSTNAERSAYAQALADALGEALGVPVTARVLARRDDAIAFVAARRLDLLVTDGLALVGRSEPVIAHAAQSPRAALYAARGASVLELKGATVSIAEVGPDAARFYANAALEGEVDVGRWFGTLREAKDATAALDAVKTGAAKAALAPADHPAGQGLAVIAQGGAIPVAVMVVVDPAKVGEAERDTIVATLRGGAGVGGGIGGWAEGRGAVLDRAAALARATPRFMTATPVLTPAPPRRIPAPPIRLNTRGKLPEPAIGPEHAVTPRLPEE